MTLSKEILELMDFPVLADSNIEFSILLRHYRASNGVVSYSEDEVDLKKDFLNDLGEKGYLRQLGDPENIIMTSKGRDVVLGGFTKYHFDKFDDFS